MEPSLNQELATLETNNQIDEDSYNQQESEDFQPQSDQEGMLIEQISFSEDTESLKGKISGKQEEIEGKQDQKLSQKTIQKIFEDSSDEKKKLKHMKRYKHDVDPKYLIAINVLFKKQIKSFMKKGQGYMLISIYHSPDCIIVFYYDENVKERVEEQITQFIDNIVVINIDKKDIQRGYNLSLSYQKKLRKQNIAIFRFMNRKKNVAEYYISGKVQVNVLDQVIIQLKKSHFSWFHLYEYRNTRSYRTIFSKLFQKIQYKRMMQNKYNAINTECCIKNPYLVNLNDRERYNRCPKLNIILTLVGKTALIHQQIDECITKYTKQNYYLICFSYKRKQKIPKNDSNRQIPDGQAFSVHEKDNYYSYIFFLFEKSKFLALKEKMIKYLQNMGVVFKGRRYFKGFCPSFKIENLSRQEKYWTYPQQYPYSTTVVRKNREETFDWKKQFDKISGE